MRIIVTGWRWVPLIFAAVIGALVAAACGDGSSSPTPGGPSAGVAVATGTPTPMPVGSSLAPPVKTKHLQPSYPAEARQQRIQGLVIVDAVIGSNGLVVETTVVRSVHPAARRRRGGGDPPVGVRALLGQRHAGARHLHGDGELHAAIGGPVKRTILFAACVLSMSASGCAKKDPAPSATSPAARPRSAAIDASGAPVGVPVGPNVRQPVKLKDVPARYPAAAREARIQGVVMMDLTIDDTGHVADAKVIGGPLELHEAAYQAAMQWVYSPTLVNGVPTAITMKVTVAFRLQ